MILLCSCVAVLLLGSSQSFAQIEHGFSVVESRRDDSPNKEITMINIFPKELSQSQPAKLGRSSSFCDEIEATAARKHCHDLLNRGIISQEFLAAFEGYDERRFRQPYPIHSAPGYINNGNAVHIEGGFHGAPSQQPVNPSNSHGTAPQFQNNSSNPVQQSPLVTFNLNSSPHFHETAVPPAEPASANNQPLPEKVDVSEAILRINTKLRVNTTDIPAVVQALNQQMIPTTPKTINTDNLSINNEQLTDKNSHVTQAPVTNTQFPTTPSTIHKTVLTQDETQSTTLSTPKMQVQTQSTTSLSTTVDQTKSTTSSTAEDHTQSPQATEEQTQSTTLPITTTQKTNYHYLIHSSPLTESQSIALLKGQTSAHDTLKSDGTAETTAHQSNPTQNNVNIQVPSGSTVSAHQHQIDMADILTNLQILTILLSPNEKEELVTESSNDAVEQERNFSSSFDTYPLYLPQARSKSEIIRSLPNYANQYSFLSSPQKDSTIASLLEQANFNTNPMASDSNTDNESINKLQIGSINDQKLTYQNLLSILQQSDQFNYYNRLVEGPSKVPSKASSESNVVKHPTVEEQQHLNAQNIFNNFNNRHQTPNPQNGVQQASSNNNDNPSNYQDLILANILQSQVLNKPTATPTNIDTNEPYIPAVHGSNLGGFAALEPQPPAAPPPPTSESFTDSFSVPSIPFPVRAAGGGSSYSSIQECLKNTACALFLAGVVATGTTAALAIPVLTPLFGAGFLGRRRREIQYFILKPEDSIQFIDDYYHYANGIQIKGLTKEAKCMYDLIMNPETEDSKYVLGNLFKYLLQNREKLLNVTVQDIETRYNKPIPENFLNFLKYDNNTDQVDLLNRTLSQEIDDSKPSNIESDIRNIYEIVSSQLDSYENDDFLSAFNTTIASTYLQDSITTERSNSETLPLDIGIFVNIHNPRKEDYQNIINLPLSQEYVNIPITHEGTKEHDHTEEHLVSMPHIQPPNTFRPVPPPKYHLRGTTYPELLEKPKQQPTGFVQASSNQNYFEANSVSSIYPLPVPARNSEDLSLDIVSITEEPNIHSVLLNNDQMSQSLKYSVNSNTNPKTLQWFTTAEQYQLNPESQEYQFQNSDKNIHDFDKILEFYKVLCHALSEPAIPHSNVTTFIAQRCLLFAHAGLLAQ